jgi:hypothetical protein
MKITRVSKSHYIVNGRKVFRPIGDKLWWIECANGYDYAVSFAEAKRIIEHSN